MLTFDLLWRIVLAAVALAQAGRIQASNSCDIEWLCETPAAEIQLYRCQRLLLITPVISSERNGVLELARRRPEEARRLRICGAGGPSRTVLTTKEALEDRALLTAFHLACSWSLSETERQAQLAYLRWTDPRPGLLGFKWIRWREPPVLVVSQDHVAGLVALAGCMPLSVALAGLFSPKAVMP